MKRLFLILATFCVCLSTLTAQVRVRLTEMDLSKVEQAYGTARKNLSASGEPLKVAGVNYNDGVGTYADSRIVISLMRKSRIMTCKVGLNDCEIDFNDPTLIKRRIEDEKTVYYTSVEKGKHFLGLGRKDGSTGGGSVVFRIVGDGKELYNSGIMRSGDEVKNVEVALGGIDTLELIAENGADGSFGDFADWLDVEFVQVAYESEKAVIKPATIKPVYKGKVPGMEQGTKEYLSGKISSLSEIKFDSPRPSKDWLIDGNGFVAKVGRSADNKDIIITNGLVSRVFRVFPNLATTNIFNNMTGETMVRAASQEGTLTIDQKNYPLGGLGGQFEYGYMTGDWLDGFSPLPDSFRVTDFRVTDLKKRMEWNERRWALVKDWNPKGKELTFVLEGPGLAEGVKAEIHFEIYDGVPIIGKWINVVNESDNPVIINGFTLEELHMVEHESALYNTDYNEFRHDQLHVESDWAQTNYTTTYWEDDPNYTSQVDRDMHNTCLLVSRFPLGPDETLEPDGVFQSYHNWIMPFDSEERERKGLFLKRFKKTLAPWTTENPIFLHCTTTKESEVKTAIDQCAETGFEMVILSFGSGLNMEDESEENIKKFKEYADYAHSKGLEIGGYSLLASRWISDEVDIINPDTGKRGGMTFGSSPCLSSEWGHEYFRKIKSFYEKTGMDFFEHDGSYSGDPCASTSHAYHRGLEDSQWTQRKMLEDLYKWMRAKGIYMNVPDMGTMLIGSSKCGVGYREVNWVLPRERQIILGRQNLYDGMWTRTPSDSWTFTPLTRYHHGGPASTLEPLDEHLDAYKAHLVQNFGSGVQSCYRGFRLYDSERTKETVKEVVSWYKKYRDILNSDVIHLRRPDGRDWDGIMHVNHTLAEKGLVMLYNPTDEDITRTITLPLYYTGLTSKAMVFERDGKPMKLKLDREYNVNVSVTIPANGYNWLVIR